MIFLHQKGYDRLRSKNRGIFVYRNRAFTLVELMVTVGIFVFMTAAIMSRYNNFYSGTLFTNMAYDIALTIRQAQTYGISVKVNPNPSDTFSSVYGVHFDSSAASNKKFILYADSGSMGYDGSETIESTYNLKQGAYVSGVCGSATEGCTPTGSATLDIVFVRPNPDANICYGGACTAKFATIRIASGDGTVTHDIKINAAGQISVSN